MLIEIEPWGGIVVRWVEVELAMLVDPHEHEYWIVWRGQPLVRGATIRC